MKFCIGCGISRPRRNWRDDLKHDWTGVQPFESRTRFSYWSCGCIAPVRLVTIARELAAKCLEYPSRFLRCSCCGEMATEHPERGDGRLKTKGPICWPCISQGGAIDRKCSKHPHKKGGKRAR